MLNTISRERQRPIECPRLSNLHADDGVDEEEHGDEQADVGQSLEGLDEGPQKDPDGVTLSQQLDQASCSEQLQEAHVERFDRLA